MSEGIAEIQARIAAIQQRFAPQPVAPSPVGTASTAAASTTGTAASFASVLDQVTAATAPDADLSKYANGRIPQSALVSIGGNDKLAAPAARAFNQMKADAARSGVTFGINDSYRSYDEQVAMAKSKGLYSQGGLAAKPGTSEHGLGLSLDLELNGKSQQWMNANAGRYGFVNNVRGEAWHWTYKD